MGVGQALGLAFHSLSGNKLRSALTISGLIIGVGAVITIMSIGQGVQQIITSRLNGLGTNLVFADPGATSSRGVRTPAGSVQTLTYEDAKAIAEPRYVPSAALVSPEVYSTAQFIYQDKNTSGRLIGVTPGYGDIHSIGIALGDWIDDAQLQSASNVVVLGASVAQPLYGTANPVGLQVRITAAGGGSGSFTVIGVGEAKGGSTFDNPDTAVYLPLTTVLIKLSRTLAGTGVQTVNHITVQAIDAEHLQSLQDEITALLLQRHHLTDPTAADFSVTSLQNELQTEHSVIGLFTIFLAAVAGISLVVGGIGVMNIMIITVTERTREIGIRKTVGARRHDILLQFLAESLVLSLLGGTGGTLMGIGLARLLGSVVNVEGNPLPIPVTPQSVILATGISAAIGIVFGVYPAFRAARLSPAEAIRHD